MTEEKLIKDVFTLSDTSKMQFRQIPLREKENLDSVDGKKAGGDPFLRRIREIGNLSMERTGRYTLLCGRIIADNVIVTVDVNMILRGRVERNRLIKNIRDSLVHGCTGTG
ncbi:MAG: hypothetical protein GX939_04340 [Clostridiaceae bacterium]|jgi:hypothetical protein|nr:hypothetical protein [Clostridiaceae bacterium]